MFNTIFERNQEATLYIGNLDSKVNEDILWELFIQCGPVVNVHLPRDKITGEHQGYGFVEFRSEEDADYAIKIMHMIKLYGKPIKVNKASQDKRTQEVGANLFVGNLDPEVDEKMLNDTFSTFGMILSIKIMRDPESGASKGYAFISYDNFDSADGAVQAMNNQYFMNRTLNVTYAFKKETKGERHGTAAERLLAANRPNANRAGALFNAPQNLPQIPEADIYPGMPPMGFPVLPNQFPPMIPGMPQIPIKGPGIPPPNMGGPPIPMMPPNFPPFPGGFPFPMPPMPPMPNMPGQMPSQGGQNRQMPPNPFPNMSPNMMPPGFAAKQ